MNINNFLRDMLDLFKSLTAEKLSTTANFKLTIILHKDMVEKLNVSPRWAAGVIGRMDINVSDSVYNSDPETLDALARELVTVMQTMLYAYTEAWGTDAAYDMLEHAAARMSLKTS